MTDFIADVTGSQNDRKLFYLPSGLRLHCKLLACSWNPWHIICFTFTTKSAAISQKPQTMTMYRTLKQDEDGVQGLEVGP